MFAMHHQQLQVQQQQQEQQQQVQQVQEQQQQPATSQIVGARKRTRDDDDMTAGSGFGERRNKRPHNLLPGTTDSRCRVIPTPLAIAVAPAAPFSAQWSSAPACSQQLGADAGVDVDMDMGVDMDVDVDPLASAAAASPSSSPSLASTLLSGGRIPTPIQPSFAVQLRGTAWGAGPGPALHHEQQQQMQQQQMQQHNGAVSGVGHEPSSGSAAVFGLMVRPQVDDVDMGAVPRAMETDAEWHSVQNRRLPSPISEVDDCTSPSVAGTCVAGSPNMVLDGAPIGSRPTWFASSPEINSEQRQQQQQQQEQEPTPPHRHNTWHAAAVPCPTRAAAGSSDDGSGGDASTTTTTSSPPRKGHTRSRHTLNSWTWQPGMQKSFSIGYRADCEKCRDKVPGHFNHIIIS